MATEEHYRTRPYVPGDDLRRVHWKQSVNTGQLVVRVPEAVPYAPTRVRLVLDTYLPPGLRVAANAGGRALKEGERAIARAPEVLDDVLDLLVEGWVGLAHTLLRRGEAVSLVVAVKDGDRIVVKELECKRGEERKWRSIGADVAWQNDFTVEQAVSSVAPLTQAKASSVVVSAGLFAPPSPPGPGTSYIVADGASIVHDPPKDDLGPLRRFFFFDYPVGAEDNRIDWRKLISPKPPSVLAVRTALARATLLAVDHARAAGAPVLLVRRRGLHLSLEAP
jgi:Protein of unknown function DUF58